MRILLTFLMLAAVSGHYPAWASQTITAGFSPGPQAVDMVDRAIGRAEQEVDVAAYSFTSQKIADALVDAHARGVVVQVLLDKRQNSQRNHPALEKLLAADIPVRVNGHYAIMHDKYLIIDNETVETGSFNYTAAAEKRNAENVVVIHNNKKLAQKFMANWQKLWAEGEPE